MDLNAPPLPEEEDEEAPPEDHGEEAPPEDHGGEAPPKNHGGKAPKKETTVELMRREREERRLKLKRTREQQPQPQPQEGPIRVYDDDPPQKRPVLVQNPNSGFGYHDRNNQNTGFRYDDRNNQNTEFRYDDRNKLPHGWLDCPSHGQLIGNCIIPSKVPLNDYFDEFIPFGKRYSMKQVLDKQQRKLGLVIDLTNTTRYYRAADWKRHGVDHVKIPCKGRDSVPDNGSVNSFLHHILKFRKRSNKNIFVHCTHGHNRTGYMIVHFLMRTCFQPISVTEAIQAFADARPPGIYKKDYIDALYAFYHEKKPQAVICPSTPEWKRSTEIDLNGEAPLDDDDGWPGPLNEESVVNEVLTLDDVLGDTVPYEQQEEMRAFCYESLELGVGPKGTSQFPGSHPVSLNRDNLQFLRQRYYYATWKADGTRYMMLIKRDGCYLIDRKFNFRRVQMRFPCRQSKDSGLAAHHFTLLDGEMVIDIRPDTQKQERRYLIYDLIAVNNVSIVKKPFEERWKMIEEEIVQPRNIERERNIIPYYRYDMEPFRVRRKDFWLLSTVPKLLKELIPRLSHESDGLIFQGWHDPYVPRTHEGLLKWKYAEMNSVDFLFELDDDRPQLFLNEKGRKKLMEGNRVMFKDESDPSEYAGKIIECSWDSKEDVWVCMRIRTDKSVPNEFNTYKKVMRSIKDNITEEVLLNEINETVRLPMYVDRMKRDQQSRTGRRK